MSIKTFFIKKVLQAKGVPKEQADAIAEKLAANPELAEKLKKLEENKELKDLFENIQNEIEEKKKGGMPEQYAMLSVMSKYKDKITKHKDDLIPLMQLLGGVMPN